MRRRQLVLWQHIFPWCVCVCVCVRHSLERHTDNVHINGHDRNITVILAKHFIQLLDDGSETCWSNFKCFEIIIIASTNYIFVHLLNNKVFQLPFHITNRTHKTFLIYVQQFHNWQISTSREREEFLLLCTCLVKEEICKQSRSLLRFQSSAVSSASVRTQQENRLFFIQNKDINVHRPFIQNNEIYVHRSFIQNDINVHRSFIQDNDINVHRSFMQNKDINVKRSFMQKNDINVYRSFIQKNDINYIGPLYRTTK